jgi:hypothetical protein
MKDFDDSNWREEYKSYTRNKMELDLLEHGPKSLSQSWHLQALYSICKLISKTGARNMTKPNDLWDDMSILNSLYGELCWDNDDPIEFIPDYENDQIIVKRKKWN